MFAPAATAEPISQAGAHQDPARAAVPPRIAALLGMLRFLITFGRDLATTLQNQAAPAILRAPTSFGTSDRTVILARIMRGLLRADALYRFLLQRAATGRDVTPPAVRTPSPRQPGAARRTEPRRVTQDAAPNGMYLPTMKELAAEVRRRPIGAVLADICDDLGLTPGQLGHARWEELRHAIAEYGGNLAGFFRRIMRRCLPLPAIARPNARPAGLSPPPYALPAPGTGPP